MCIGGVLRTGAYRNTFDSKCIVSALHNRGYRHNRVYIYMRVRVTGYIHGWIGNLLTSSWYMYMID